MTGRETLNRFLHTDPDDAGCAETFALLHVYAEQVKAGRDAAELHPDIARHLATCDPCAEDLTGLLALLDYDAA